MVAASWGSSRWLDLALYMARCELRRRYAGSLFGWAWALIFPAIQVGLYLFVLSVGLRAGAPAVPTGAMLAAAILPWFTLSDALSAMTASLAANAAMIKQSSIPAQLFPIAAGLAGGIVHAVLLALTLGLLAVLGYPPTPRLAALPYFAGCLGLLTLGLGSLLALAHAAFRDVAQAVGAAVGLWFWATPILWSSDRLPAGWLWIARANPAAYIVEGYRWALLGAPRPVTPDALWFWAEVSILLALAGWIFARFRSEVGDVI